MRNLMTYYMDRGTLIIIPIVAVVYMGLLYLFVVSTFFLASFVDPGIYPRGKSPLFTPPPPPPFYPVFEIVPFLFLAFLVYLFISFHSFSSFLSDSETLVSFLALLQFPSLVSLKDLYLLFSLILSGMGNWGSTIATCGLIG